MHVLPGTRGYSWCAVLAAVGGPGMGWGGEEGILAEISFTPVTRAGAGLVLSPPALTGDTDTHIALFYLE